MDVQQAGGGPDPGAGTAGDSGSRVGLIVGVALALLVVLAVVVVLLLRDDGDAQPEATPTPTATATATVTTGPSATATASPSPTESPIPGDVPQLRPDGIGPIELRMTAAQAVATGEVSEQDTEPVLVADPDTYPGLTIGYDPDADSIESLVVSDSSPIRTPDGMGVDSTPQDVEDAYGPLVQEQTDPGTGDTWYLVAVDDVGYAFVPADDELVLVAGTDTFLLDLVPSEDL